MVPTLFPDNVDFMAIAMEEKARIRDNMPSAILNVAFGSGPNGDDAQEMYDNNAEVGFFFESDFDFLCSAQDSSSSPIV